MPGNNRNEIATAMKTMKSDVRLSMVISSMLIELGLEHQRIGESVTTALQGLSAPLQTRVNASSLGTRSGWRLRPDRVGSRRPLLHLPTEEDGDRRAALQVAPPATARIGHDEE